MTISDTLKRRLRSAEWVTAFTGAGISAESGVPTFRGEDGLWKKFKPEELANFGAFMRNPELVWEWYSYRRELIGKTEPNAGHITLAQMEQRYPHMAIITQNVDNLHRRAGSTVVHELHGNINRNYCTGCGKYATEEFIASQTSAPKCPSCRSLIRPDVVWFGEQLPVDEWNLSVSAAERADIFFVIGTSAIVYPAASLPFIAKRAGAYVVEINIERTDFSGEADEVLIGPSARVLPELLALAQPFPPSPFPSDGKGE